MGINENRRYKIGNQNTGYNPISKYTNRFKARIQSRLHVKTKGKLTYPNRRHQLFINKINYMEDIVCISF